MVFVSDVLVDINDTITFDCKNFYSYVCGCREIQREKGRKGEEGGRESEHTHPAFRPLTSVGGRLGSGELIFH